MAHCPVAWREGPLGALVLQRRQPGEFPQAVVNLMQAFADSRQLRWRTLACSRRSPKRAESSKSQASTSRSSSPT